MYAVVCCRQWKSSKMEAERQRLLRHQRRLRRAGGVDTPDSVDTASTQSRSSTATAPSPQPPHVHLPNGNDESADEGPKTGEDEEKQLGLIDGLTQFFTPSFKRKSRVSLNALSRSITPTILKGNGRNGHLKTKPPQQQSKSQQAASRLIKKSRLLQANKARLFPKGRPPGSGAVRGLFDGLSHLYTAHGERKRGVPLYHMPVRSPFKLPQPKFQCEFELYEYTTKSYLPAPKRAKSRKTFTQKKHKQSSGSSQSYSSRGLLNDPTLSPGPRKGRGRYSFDGEDGEILNIINHWWKDIVRNVHCVLFSCFSFVGPNYQLHSGRVPQIKL